MALLPVVERELRVAARRPGTYWGRVVSGGVGVLVFSYILWTDGISYIFRGSPVGHRAFNALFYLGILSSLFAGTSLTSDAIASEKREGTLGLLFLTDLKAWQIALGKLAASSIGAVYWLLGFFPVLALCLLLGGISGGEFARSILTLLMTLGLSLAVGLAVSTYSRESMRAAGRANLLLVFLAFGPRVLVSAVALGLQKIGISEEITSQWTESEWISWISPLAAWSNTQADGANDGRYWASIAYTLLITLVCFAVVVWKLPMAWQDRPAKDRPAKSWWRFPNLKVEREKQRRRWLDENPLAWRFLRRWFRGDLIFSVLGLWIVVAFGILSLFLSNSSRGTRTTSQLLGPAYIAMTFAGHVLLRAWMSNEATRPWTDDRRSGAMEWLLVAPFTPRDFIASGWAALRYRFLIPTGLVAGLDIVAMVVAPGEMEADGYWHFWWFTVARIFLLVLDLVAIGWLGMWIGISSQYRRPQGIAFSRIVGWPLIIIGLSVPFFGIFSQFKSNVEWDFLFLSVFFMTAWNIGWMIAARGRLLAEFRERGAQPAGLPSGWFGRISVPKQR